VSFLTDPTAIARFRREGAEAIMKAVDLGAEADRSIAAATLLDKYGERDAATRQLRRAYAITDDPVERTEIAGKLAQLAATEERDAAVHDMRLIEQRWRKEYNFLTRDAYMLLGPISDPFRCAGKARDSACPRDWTDALSPAPE
jgi:hypothetical protein